MSEAVLIREQMLRELELDEDRRAARMRAEVVAPLPRRRVPHRTQHLLVLAKDGRAVAAKFLLEWWKKRGAYGGHRRPVSTNEINRLAGIIRRLE
jgi:hypothetical protein